MWGDQCTFFLWLNEKLFCRLLPVSLHIHQVYLFFYFIFLFLFLFLFFYFLHTIFIFKCYCNTCTICTICAYTMCQLVVGLKKCHLSYVQSEKMSPFLCTICNFPSTFTPSTLPLLDLWPQVAPATTTRSTPKRTPSPRRWPCKLASPLLWGAICFPMFTAATHITTPSLLCSTSATSSSISHISTPLDSISSPITHLWPWCLVCWPLVIPKIWENNWKG